MRVAIMADYAVLTAIEAAEITWDLQRIAESCAHPRS